MYTLNYVAKLPDIEELSRGGPLYSARAIIMENGSAAFQVLHKQQYVQLADKDSYIDYEAFQNLLCLFSENYYLWVGVSPSEFAKMSEGIHINLKNKVVLEHPFQRVQSSQCKGWFKISKNLSRDQKQGGATCGKCKYFYRYLYVILLERAVLMQWSLPRKVYHDMVLKRPPYIPTKIK